MMINFRTTDESHFTFDESRREIVDYDGVEKNVVVPTHIDGCEVVSIGPEAFWNKGIKTVTLPPTLSVIGFYAFAFNELTSVTIPESAALIEDGAFMYNKITRLRIAKNIFAIPHSAFRHNKLEQIVIPENTQEILSEAFANNPIAEITFEGAPTFIHRHAFDLGKDEMKGVKIAGREAEGLRELLDHHARSIDDYRRLSANYRSD